MNIICKLLSSLADTHAQTSTDRHGQAQTGTDKWKLNLGNFLHLVM